MRRGESYSTDSLRQRSTCRTTGGSSGRSGCGEPLGGISRSVSLPGSVTTTTRKTGNIYVWIRPEDDLLTVVDYVAHEAHHAIGFLCRNIDENTQLRDLGEVPTYLQGYLTSEMLGALGWR